MIFHNIINMEEFIKDIYACDTVPWEHLIAKSKYLLKSEKRCLVVLVENKRPDETFFGEGAFRHIQCLKIKDVKNQIRSLYNPISENPDVHDPLLPNGVGSDHCVYATDYEEQIRSDIDIFCEDRYKMMKYTLDYLRAVAGENFDIKVEQSLEHHYCHIDVFFKEGTLDLRFDLIDSFDMYKEFSVHPSFKEELFNNKAMNKGAWVPR